MHAHLGFLSIRLSGFSHRLQDALKVYDVLRFRKSPFDWFGDSANARETNRNAVWLVGGPRAASGREGCVLTDTGNDEVFNENPC